MCNFFNTLLLCLFSVSCWAHLPSNFPLYHEVVEYLIEKGITEVSFDGDTKLNIEKDTEGFWITVARYQRENYTWRYEDKQLVYQPRIC